MEFNTLCSDLGGCPFARRRKLIRSEYGSLGLDNLAYATNLGTVKVTRDVRLG